MPFITGDSMFGSLITAFRRSKNNYEFVRYLNGKGVETEKIASLSKEELLTLYDNWLINAWNSVVTKDDEVYHLGNLTPRDEKYACELKDKLNHKRLYALRGKQDTLRPNFYNPTMCTQFTIKLVANLHDFNDFKERPFICSHYRMHDWDGCLNKTIHVYCRDYREPAAALEPNVYNVSVDVVGATPLRLSSLH